jgi:hypothetical protein
VQKKILKTKRLKIIIMLKRIKKKRIKKKTKIRVLRTDYLIKKFNKYKRSSRKYYGFVLYY